jgi:hypothetical protein
MTSSMEGETGGPETPPATPLQPKLSPSCVNSTVSIDAHVEYHPNVFVARSTPLIDTYDRVLTLCRLISHLLQLIPLYKSWYHREVVVYC